MAKSKKKVVAKKAVKKTSGKKKAVKPQDRKAAREALTSAQQKKGAAGSGKHEAIAAAAARAAIRESTGPSAEARAPVSDHDCGSPAASEPFVAGRLGHLFRPLQRRVGYLGPGCEHERGPRLELHAQAAEGEDAAVGFAAPRPLPERRTDMLSRRVSSPAPLPVTFSKA